MTRSRAIAAGVLLVLVVALVATAAPARERPAELGRMAAEGAVKLSAAGSGHAILTASGLRPGQSVAGNIALANVGESRGRLTLRRTGMVDTPGRFGGRLSDALLLRVEELGGGSWTGPLAVRIACPPPEAADRVRAPSAAMRPSSAGRSRAGAAVATSATTMTSRTPAAIARARVTGRPRCRPRRRPARRS